MNVVGREQWDRASGAAHIAQRKSGEMARGRSPLSFSTVRCARKHFHRRARMNAASAARAPGGYYILVQACLARESRNTF